MSKGAVPVPYIIALLLGIAVVAIIGYWFFVLSGQTGGEATLSTCNTRAYTYCAGWQVLGYTGDDNSGPSVGWFSESHKECSAHLSNIGSIGFSYVMSDADQGNFQDDVDNCKGILGTGGSGGSGSGNNGGSGGPVISVP